MKMSTFNVSEYILVCLAELLQGKTNSKDLNDIILVCIYMHSHQTKPQPEDSSRLFTLISENFAALFLTMERNHKDEVYIVCR